MTLFFPNALKSYFWSKRYLELRYRAEILTHLSKALGYVFFGYLLPEVHHGRREEHPHEAHQEDEKMY